jgi:hypothetical protein
MKDKNKVLKVLQSVLLIRVSIDFGRLDPDPGGQK